MRKQCLNIVLTMGLTGIGGCADADGPSDGDYGSTQSDDSHPDPTGDAADEGTADDSATTDPDGGADSSDTDGSDSTDDTGSDDNDSTGDDVTDDTDSDSGTGDADTGDTDTGDTDTGDTDTGDTDTGDTDTGDTDTDDTGTDDDAPDFRIPGPFAVTTSDSSTDVGTGCTMASTRYEPEGSDTEATVVLVHGFMGARASMDGWARHFASWGIPVIAPDLCHATILDADHEQNGLDLAGLVDTLGLGDVAFAGFSAGGLASVLAAAQVDSTVALLGLDMVDSGGLGAAVAATIDVPAHDLVGEPSSCNDTGNGVAVFQAMPTHRVVRLSDSIHCDFQNPADGLCGLTCARGAMPEFTPEQINTAILALATAFLAWQTEAEASGEQWWNAGHSYWDELETSGLLTEL